MPQERSRTLTVLAAGALAAAVLMAPTPSTASATDHTAKAVGRHVSVKISTSRTITMPRVLRPGVHRITIHSKKRSSLQIVRTRKGYTGKQLASDSNAAMGKGNISALKRMEKNTVFISGVATFPGMSGTMLTRLARGKYIAVDSNTRKMTAKKMRHFTVSGNRLTGKAPKVPTIKALHAVDFSGRPASIPRYGLLGFANKSTDNHFVEVALLKKGKTIDDLAAWVEAAKQGEDTGPPLLNEAHAVESGIVSPGHRMSFAYHLPPGDYAVLCWWPDADMGGMPHVFMGMYRSITVR